MTRVTNLGQHQSALLSLMRGQENLFDSNRRISTGKEAARFDQLDGRGASLLGTKAVKSRITATIEANQRIGQRLEMYNVTLGSLAEAADTLRQEVIKAVGNNSGIALIDSVRSLFDRAVDIVNTRFDGRYIYAGTRTDTPPFTADSEAKLLALAQTSDGFVNNQDLITPEIDEGRTLSYGVLANDAAQDLMDSLRRLMQFENGTLPPGAAGGGPASSFGVTLTAAQRDFLLGELASIKASIQTVRDAEARNGVRMAELDKLATRQEDELVFLTGFISDIEDTDLPEAVAKLNQDRTALEATIQITARLGRISLLDFI